MDLIRFAKLFNKIAPIVFIVLVGGYFLYNYLKKRGILKGKEVKEADIDIRKAKKTSINNFNLIDDDIRENIVITNNKTQYTTGVSCSGVSYDKLSEIEQRIIENNYIGFWKMVDWDIQLYIQSRQMNVEQNLQYLEDCLNGFKKEEERLLIEKNRLISIMEAAPTRKELYVDELNRVEQQLVNMPWLINHKEEEIAYAKAVSSPDSQPQFDTYILYSYIHDDSELSVKLNEDEIFKQAKTNLEIKTRNVMTVMGKCMVNCKLLSKSELSEMIYRAYNLSDADVVRFQDYLKTSAFDPFVTTDYHLTKDLEDMFNSFNRTVVDIEEEEEVKESVS